MPFVIETSGAWSVKAVALWKPIKASYKAAVADDFASATFLNTDQAKTWSAFTLRSWYRMVRTFRGFFHNSNSTFTETLSLSLFKSGCNIARKCFVCTWMAKAVHVVWWEA